MGILNRVAIHSRFKINTSVLTYTQIDTSNMNSNWGLQNTIITSLTYNNVCIEFLHKCLNSKQFLMKHSIFNYLNKNLFVHIKRTTC